MISPNFIRFSSDKDSLQIEKCFAYGARLAQLVEHQTFNLRAMGSSPISGSNGILYVCTLC